MINTSYAEKYGSAWASFIYVYSLTHSFIHLHSMHDVCATNHHHHVCGDRVTWPARSKPRGECERIVLCFRCTAIVRMRWPRLNTANKVLLVVVSVLVMVRNLDVLERLHVQTRVSAREEVVAGPQRQLFRHTDDALQTGLNVISYCLYGNDPRYTQGILENAKLAKKYFRRWTMRVYVRENVREETLRTLQEDYDVDLVDMTKHKLKNKMMWRFLVGSDPSIDRFIVRDADSRLSYRDAKAVQEWVRSRNHFHVVRDHPSHSLYPISGGMWGATRHAFPDMDTKIYQTHKFLTMYRNPESYRRHKEDKHGVMYGDDMVWLQHFLWPIAQKNVLQHDAFSCNLYRGAIPFPTKRIGGEHVGSVWLGPPWAEREYDVKMLLAAKQPNDCHDRNEIDPIDWEKDLPPPKPAT